MPRRLSGFVTAFKRKGSGIQLSKTGYTSTSAHQASQIMLDANGTARVLASGNASTNCEGYMAGSARSSVSLTFTLDQPYAFVLAGSNSVNGGRSYVAVAVEFAQVSKSIDVALYSYGSESFTLSETGLLAPGVYSLTGYAESSKNDPWGYYPFNPDLSSTYGTAQLGLDLTLTPVPEPATLGLLALGGLALLRRRYWSADQPRPSRPGRETLKRRATAIRTSVAVCLGLLGLIAVAKADATPASDQFPNGGFESGTMAGWNNYADEEILTSLGSIQPTEGSFFACVTNGPGAPVEYARLRVTPAVEIPAWATGLAFDWDYLTAEATPSDLFNDYGQIVVEVSGTQVFNVKVDTKTEGFYTIQQGGVTSPNGSLFTERLGWHGEYVPLEAYQGRASNLLFDVFCLDNGAADVDSAMLVDNILFVPEPATLSLLLLGGMSILRRRRSTATSFRFCLTKQAQP